MLNITNCQLKDPQISARGAKSCPLLNDNGDKFFFQLGSKANPASTPFGATAFNDEKTTRKTIEFNLTPEQEKGIAAFDEWAIKYLSQNSERLFKKKLSIEQVKEGYRSPMTKKGTYNAHLRCKVNTGGTAMVRCWDAHDKRVDLPQDMRNHELVPRINISHLWMMSREYGWVFQVYDLMVCETEETCPFE